MNDDVQHLVLSPFCDVVAKGTIAVDNAKAAGSQPMLKAAQGLLSNGERALKKIEPVCRRQLEECGVNFVDALKENDEISSFREQLNDLLWDLDDAIEADGFDVEVYSRLQTLLRTAALRTADIIVRMKLERVQLHLVSPIEASRPGTSQGLPKQALPVEPEIILTQDTPPPIEPPINPWRRDETFSSVLNSEEADGIDRRPRVANSDVGDYEGQSWGSPTWDNRSVYEPLIPKTKEPTPDSVSSSPRTHQSFLSVTSPSSASSETLGFNSPRLSHGSSVGSSKSGRHIRDSGISGITEPTSRAPSRLDQNQETNNFPSPATSYSSPTLSPILPLRPKSRQQAEQAGLETNIQRFDEGLIPVTEEPEPTSLELAQTAVRSPDCSITPASSFHQFKGFCDGANEIIRGNLGVKQVKQPVGLMGNGFSVKAKCKHCMFQLDWKPVEDDLHGHSNASYKTGGVSFRLRILFKSHLPARHIDEQLYACVFCVHSGKTTEETDATVFFSQKQLFAHLARHPRPFPTAPGVTVIDGPTIPAENQNNFDLHFPSPPTKSKTPSDLAQLPTAIASESFRPVHGMLRFSPDRAPVLQFAAGAKLVGLEFPEHYKGEWASGWGDNTKAVFPMEYIRLQPPEKNAVLKMQAMSATSGLTVVSKWKRNPKYEEKNGDGTQWLKFDRGEVITGVSYPDKGFWCWSGVNAKGKWGIFPKDWVEVGSLVDVVRSPGASSVYSTEKEKGGMFARLRVKRRESSGRGSVSGSASIHSGDLGMPRAGGPSVY
ncbi:hypothetical protein OQA88_12834 [Cercophora sp. LCS_1]